MGHSQTLRSACSNSVELVPLQPIIISILSYHYKELKDCVLDVELMMSVGDYSKQVSMKEEEETREGASEEVGE